MKRINSYTNILRRWYLTSIFFFDSCLPCKYYSVNLLAPSLIFQFIVSIYSKLSIIVYNCFVWNGWHQHCRKHIAKNAVLIHFVFYFKFKRNTHRNDECPCLLLLLVLCMIFTLKIDSYHKFMSLIPLCLHSIHINNSND